MREPSRWFGHLFAPRSRIHALVAVSTVGSMLLAGGSAIAADMLPVGSLEPSAIGGVSAADGSRKGDVRVGVSLNAAKRVVEAGSVGLSEGDTQLLRDAHTSSVLLGVGLSPSLELGIGLHGTYEDVPAAARDAAFPIKDPNHDDDWRESFKVYGFSGASLALRMHLFERSGLRLGLMPFLESGAGDRAAYSLTRSEGPKAGLMGLASYGAKGIADVSLNLGYRYRDPETVGTLTWRHETLAKFMAQAYLTPAFSLFVAGEGRRLQVNEKPEGSAKVDGYRYGGQAKVGLAAYYENTMLSVYSGGHGREDDALGYGRRSYGMSLSVAFQGGKARQEGKLPKPSAQKSKNKAQGDDLPEEFRPKRAYDEMKGDPVDVHQLIGNDPKGDFARAEKEAKQRLPKDGEMSDDEKVAHELEQMRIAEDKAAAERSAQELKDREKQRKEARERAKEEEENMREWMKEAEEETAAIPGIDNEQMNWRGLEGDDVSP